MKIRAAREIAWRARGALMDRQILEFESLYRRARDETEIFIDWVIGGEDVDSSAPIKRGLDKESAIGPAMTKEKHRASWGSLQIDGGNGSDDPDEEGWNKHETVLRDLHMAVHWRQNADEQQRAHREAQEAARLRNKVANAVAAETSSHLETMAQKNQAAAKVAQKPLLLDIDLGDDESTLPLTGKNDDSKSILSGDANVKKSEITTWVEIIVPEGENVGKEQDKKRTFEGRIPRLNPEVHLIGLQRSFKKTLSLQLSGVSDLFYVINNSMEPILSKTTRPGSAIHLKLISDVGRLGYKITSAFANIAFKTTKIQAFNPRSTSKQVFTQLSIIRSAGKVIVDEFLVEGKEALEAENYQEVLGSANASSASFEEEADEAFAALDQDGNGNITLDEMVIKVVEIVLLLHNLVIFNHDFLERAC
ncbi:hypothetical protein V490_09462 [Pseudogymnoascus sp. VKM F-3557]|nr:hypothetical protein V490_09462 [Pseudogymnoascus sp. VKM F-3557]